MHKRPSPPPGYRTVYGIIGNAIVEEQAMPASNGGWIVRRGCFREFVPKELLSETRAGAEARLRQLGPV